MPLLTPILQPKLLELPPLTTPAPPVAYIGHMTADIYAMPLVLQRNKDSQPSLDVSL